MVDTEKSEMMEIDEEKVDADLNLTYRDATTSVTSFQEQPKTNGSETYDIIDEPEIVVINKRKIIEDLRQHYTSNSSYSTQRKEWIPRNNKAISLANSKESEINPTLLSVPTVKPSKFNFESNIPIQSDPILKTPTIESSNKTKAKSTPKLKRSDSKSKSEIIAVENSAMKSPDLPLDKEKTSNVMWNIIIIWLIYLLYNVN